MIDGVYPFPITQIEAGKTAEVSLTLGCAFRIAYFVASATNAADLWLEDILIGQASLMPELARGEAAGVPWELFYGVSDVRLTFSEPENLVPLQTPITLKFRNRGKESRTIRFAVMGETIKADC